MKSNTRLFLSILCFSLSLNCVSLKAAEEPGARAKAIAEAGKANADAARTNLLAYSEYERMKGETAKLWAEAEKALSEAHLNETKREQIYLEMARLQQRMRITEHEFHRITKADYDMEYEIAFLKGQNNIIRPLTLGRANWKTWLGLELLMERVGDADIIVQVMFDIKVEELAAGEFIANESDIYTEKFPGGNLGELYTFVQRRDYSFRKFGPAHKYIMKVLAMMSKAAELRIRELRDINQAIRLTIAKID